MFKTINLLDDQDIEEAVKYLKSKDAPEVIILNIRGTCYLFKTTEAIEAMECSLEEASKDEQSQPESRN